MNNFDCLFAEKPVFEQAQFVKGIYPAAKGEKDVFVKNEGAESDKGSFVMPVHCRSLFVTKFEQKPAFLRTALCDIDPRTLKEGEGVACKWQEHLQYFEGEAEGECVDFLCAPTKMDQYLIIYTGSEDSFFIGENPVWLGHDTEDCWYTPAVAGDLNGGEGSFGNWEWSASQLYENLYEPLRNKYPEYISRTWIGKDQTNTYDMWQYTFEPKDYEQTLYLTACLHGPEIDGYYGLTQFLHQLTEEDGSHPGMHYVREKVRLIVVPVVNVYSAATNHERRNSAGVDLNRDWLAHSQAETINVLRQIHLFKDEIAAIIDFHGCRPTTAPLYYQFSMQSTNSNVCRKVANHIQQRLYDMGREKGEPILSNIPGKYNKSNLFLQGYCYNTFNIPTLVAEHNPGRWYEEHSAESLQWATECYGNLIIQHALAKLKTK